MPDGRTLKCLTIVDEFTRECLAIDVAGSIRSARVIDVLTRLVSLHGAPQYVRSDNGPEFVALALLRWTQEVGIDPAFIDPGKPWQNGTDESFNGKFRNECSTVEWFRNRVEAHVGIERWRRHYNEERPHMSLGDQTPRRVQEPDPKPERLFIGGPDQRCSPVATGPNKPGRSAVSKESYKVPLCHVPPVDLHCHCPLNVTHA